MEDPDMEWDIQDYPPSREGEVTKVRWIFNKGLWLGKKVVITGVAISSALFVLPPLVVCSALGFAFSVPFGLVFASYACTDKVMSKLLPTPERSYMLDYYTDVDEEEEKKNFGKFVMDEEEEDLEDIKRGVGMRINMEEDDDYWQKDNGSWEEYPTVYSDENMKEEVYEEDVGEYVGGDYDYTQTTEMRDEKEGEDYIKNIGENVVGEDIITEEIEGKGYNEDVGEYMEAKDEPIEGTEREIEVREEGDRQILSEETSNDVVPLAEIRKVEILVRGNKDNNYNNRELEEIDLVAREVKGGKGSEIGTTDNEEIVRGSTEWLEKIRDEGNVGDGVTFESSDAKGMRGVDEEDDVKSATISKPIGYPFKDDDLSLKTLIVEVKETGDKERTKEKTSMPFEGGDVKLERPTEKVENIALGDQEGNVHNKVEQVGKVQDKELGNGNIGYVNGTSSFGGNLDKTMDQKPKVQEKLSVREEKDKDSVDQFKDMTLEKTKQYVIESNADMRETADESGFDLFDGRNAPSYQDFYPALQVKGGFNESTTEVNVDFMALPTSLRVFDSSHVKNALEKDEVPSSQVQLKEEKIWEQIEAMRGIVGYKGERQGTCIEELEALYIFTGVEPPPSFKDQSDDLADYHEEVKSSGMVATKNIFLALINAYAACGQFDKGKEVVLDKGIPVKNLTEIKSGLVSALASNGQMFDTLNVYEEIKQVEADLEPKAIISLIEHLQSEGELDRLLLLLEQLKDTDQWVDGCFRVVLYCVRHKHLSAAVDLLKQLKDKYQRDIVAKEVLFDEVFAQVAEREPPDVQFGLDLLEAIKKDVGLLPSRKNLDFLLSACVKAKDRESSLIVWNEYQKADLPYNVLNFVRMYQALLASGDQ